MVLMALKEDPILLKAALGQAKRPPICRARTEVLNFFFFLDALKQKQTRHRAECSASIHIHLWITFGVSDFQ